MWQNFMKAIKLKIIIALDGWCYNRHGGLLLVGNGRRVIHLGYDYKKMLGNWFQ